jgi:hypothetical protein
MPSRRQLQLSAEAETAADHLLLDLLRALNRRGRETPIQSFAVLTALVRKIDTVLEDRAEAAISEGETFATLGHLLQISRQAAAKRFK